MSWCKRLRVYLISLALSSICSEKHLFYFSRTEMLTAMDSKSQCVTSNSKMHDRHPFNKILLALSMALVTIIATTFDFAFDGMMSNYCVIPVDECSQTLSV